MPKMAARFGGHAEIDRQLLEGSVFRVDRQRMGDHLREMPQGGDPR